MTEIYKLIQIIETEFDEVEKGMIAPDTEIQSVLSLNSMNIAIMLTCIELDFNVVVSAQDLKQCNTFKDIFNLIQTATHSDV